MKRRRPERNDNLNNPLPAGRKKRRLLLHTATVHLETAVLNTFLRKTAPAHLILLVRCTVRREHHPPLFEIENPVIVNNRDPHSDQFFQTQKTLLGQRKGIHKNTPSITFKTIYRINIYENPIKCHSKTQKKL